ncbi:phage tail tape measure protein [Pseudobacillus sp. FSL P4-0506]|uniref:phage tail tape measure protein n=1 Tax=Pseudobacillus sp. FSL P4-0506 TaxID=2921576 RepID=UPI0030FC60A1
MAKLTAVFEMKDNISRRLRGLHGNLESIESITESTTTAMRRLDRARANPRLEVIDTATGTIRVVERRISTLDSTTAAPTIEAIDRLTGTLDQIDRRLDSVDSARSTAEIAAVDKLSSVLERIERRLDGVDSERATAEITAEDQASSVIENIQGRLDQLKGTVLTIGAAAGISGAGVLGSGSSSMEQNARTSAVTGIDVATIKKMTNDIFYKEKAGNSREEVSLSIRNIAQQTDLKGNQLKTASEISNKIAMIHEKDVPEVDRSLSSMMKNFKIDSTRAGDNIAYVFKNAGDQYEDLLDTFNEYSSSFVDMSLKPEQVSAAFVAGTKGGARNFDDMADAVREFNIKRLEASDEQVAAFSKALGPAETKKMFKGFKEGAYSGEEALYKLAHGLSKIKDESKRAEMATALIGTKYEDLKQPILDMASAINDPIYATGELNKQFHDMRNNNPMTPISDAGRRLSQVMSEIGTGIITNVAPAFEKLNEWMDSKEGQEAIENMTTAISDFAEKVGSVLVPAIQFGIEHFKVIAPIVGGAAIAITGLGVALATVLPAVKAFRFAKGLLTRPPRDNGLDDINDSMSRMDRRSRRGARGIRGLTDKLKDLFKVRPPADNPLFGDDTRTGRNRNTRSGRRGGGRGLGGAGKGLGILGTFAAFMAVDQAGTGIGDWLFGHKAGQEKFNGLLSNPFKDAGTYAEDRQGALSKLFFGDKENKENKPAAQPTATNDGKTQGQAFGTNFMAGLNSAPMNVTSWLNEKVYKPVGSAATNSKNLGYAFSAGFVAGLSSAPVNVYSWINQNIYVPFGSAAKNAQHLGYAFSYGFVTGLNSAPVNVYSWINQQIYIPVGSAVKSAQHFGYAFSYGFVSGMKNSPLSVSSWVTSNIYQPLNQAAAGAKLYGSSLVHSFKNGIKAVPVGMSVWLNNHVAQPMLKFIPSGQGFGQGMIGYFITGMRNKKADVSAEAKSLAKAVESAFRKELGIHSPSRVMADLGYWSAMGVVKGFSSVDVSKIAKNKAGELMGSFGNFSGGGAAMARSAIMQALQITGMPMSWLEPLMWVAQKESGFNPNAINNWDINARRGDPSVGLFQIIGETFKRWKLPGMNDRRNPLHSAIAAIRYINGRYGGIQNHPGVKSRSRGGGYKPYKRGGVITHDHIARVGEGNKREVIIPLEQYRNRALGLLEYAQNALGVSPQPTLVGADTADMGNSAPVVLPEEEKQAVRNVMSRPMQTMKQGIRDVIVQIMGESHYHNEMDAEKVGKIAVKAVEQQLEEEYFAGGEMAVYD